MPYSISAHKIQQLFGATFRIAGPAGEFIFRIPDKERARLRRGVEGYGLLLTCVHPTRGELPAFLKIFSHDVPERLVRTHYLISLGLAKHFDWLFMAAPFCAVRRLFVNDVEIVGHVALEVRAAGGGSAEDIGRLRSGGRWPWPAADRRRFAAQLACAVEALESFRLAHADIAPQNIMIGADELGRPAATLCDFDAFYHPLQPPLPERVDGISARPLGTSGYQSPAMVRNLRADKSGLMVESDRFALAAMACDLVCLEPSDRREPSQPLLADEAIALASTLSIPRAVRARWPEGVDLLDRALRAKDDGAMPAPVDWMRALGMEVTKHVPPEAPRSGARSV